MTFVSISISLITSNILENKWHDLKEVIAQLLYMMIFIIMNLKFK